LSKEFDPRLGEKEPVTPVVEIDGVNLYRDDDCPLRWIYRVEPVVATIALVAALPLALVIGIVIAVLSGRSPLIRHSRVGWRGCLLRMLKFRTMWDLGQRLSVPKLIEDVESAVPVDKTAADARIVSRFAALCRRYSLDEIPQLYHVARGQMSFVGPRPITRGELEEHYKSHMAEVLCLRPGITGLWQILGRSRLSYSRRVRLDLILVRRASPYLYFRILLRTIPKVIRGYDAC
jgi:exopolysaccharide production protein ExoY